MEKIIIDCNQVAKKFISYKKKPGLRGAIYSLFKRNYIEKYAVKEFSFQVKQGEMVGLLGPNGAGKTTLMKMLTGIIVPSSGEINILDYSPSKRDKIFRKNIALVMGQKSQLWWDIPAMDSLLLLQKFYEIPESEFIKKVDYMAKMLEVTDLLHIHIRKLSLGERMKMELMASLLHSPQVIFLDEPTIGLDLVAQENIRNFLINYQQSTQCTIIITSHYMSDVEALCDRIILIQDGLKSFDGPIEQFENILGHEKEVSFSFTSPVNTKSTIFNNLDAKWNNNFTKVDLRVPENLLREIGLKVLQEMPVSEFNTEKMPIERVMKTLMKNPKILTKKP